MSLASVIRALHSADIWPTGREVAEALWLARHMAPAAVAPAKKQLELPSIEYKRHEKDEKEPKFGSSSDEPDFDLNQITYPRASSPVRGEPVDIPDLPGLRNQQRIQQALRPLRQHGSSRKNQVLDEDATANFIANTGVWLPITRPAPERWFDLILAVDSSESMDLWRPLIRDLRMLLVGTGAFRDVRVWRFDPERPTEVSSPNSRSAAHSSRELIQSGGRRLFVVVTDGAAQSWHDGTAHRILAEWGRAGSVAILQPLPEQMWARTGLAAAPALVRASMRGLHNSQLQAEYRRRHFQGIPIPVLGVEPKALRSWAQLVTGTNSTTSIAVTPADIHRPRQSPSIGASQTENALSRFRAGASPDAYQLAVYLSAVPLTLPIMRLVQHLEVPGSNPSALAEVILGGLTSRTGNETFEFLPGVREELLQELRRSELAMVFSAVSEYVAERAGIPTQTFAAIAENSAGPVATDVGALGWVPLAVAARLGLHEPPQDRRNPTVDQPAPPLRAPGADASRETLRSRTFLGPGNLRHRYARPLYPLKWDFDKDRYLDIDGAEQRFAEFQEIFANPLLWPQEGQMFVVAGDRGYGKTSFIQRCAAWLFTEGMGGDRRQAILIDLSDQNWSSDMTIDDRVRRTLMMVARERNFLSREDLASIERREAVEDKLHELGEILKYRRNEDGHLVELVVILEGYPSADEIRMYHRCMVSGMIFFAEVFDSYDVNRIERSEFDFERFEVDFHLFKLDALKPGDVGKFVAWVQEVVGDWISLPPEFMDLLEEDFTSGDISIGRLANIVWGALDIAIQESSDELSVNHVTKYFTNFSTD